MTATATLLDFAGQRLGAAQAALAGARQAAFASNTVTTAWAVAASRSRTAIAAP